MSKRRITTIRRAPRPAFTLTELLVVLMVISILASTVMFALYGAGQQARESRARAQISKLQELLMTRWEWYRTRPVRMLNLPAQARYDPRAMATARLNVLRDLMRLEIPDRKTDVADAPFNYTLTYYFQSNQYQTTVSIARPACSREYLRRVGAVGGFNAWTGEYQDSECLYMIIASMRDIEGNGLDVLYEGEIGDKDGDGMPEILDPWGTPIAFLRWPAGLVVHPGKNQEWGVNSVDDDSNGTVDDFAEAGWLGTDDIQSRTNLQRIQLDPGDLLHVAPEVRDPFDPLRVDWRPTSSMGSVPMFTTSSQSLYYFNFALYPLICSAGPDEVLDIIRYDYDPQNPSSGQLPFDYYRTGTNAFGGVINDPYSILPTCRKRLGEPVLDSFGYVDNITNHAAGG